MVKEELLKRTPLRILDQTTHGGPGKGAMGAVVARKGVGKTALLVHLATMRLLDGKQVIHVSFATKTDHISEWYEEIFDSVSRRAGLDHARDIHDEIVQRRVIMNFSQAGIPVERILSSLRAMIGQGHFAADLVVVDGYDFVAAGRASLDLFAQFARDMNVEIWFSVSLGEQDVPDERSVPPLLAPHAELFATIVGMRATEGSVSLCLIRDRDVTPVPDLRLKLDPKTLLVDL